MAEFKVEEIKLGYEGGDFNYIVSISNILFNKDDEVVIIPDLFNGKPITHIGYGQAFVPAHEVWCDWHHPSKGSDYEPDKYERDYLTFQIPEYVKKIVLPKTIKDVCYCAFKFNHDLVIEIDEDNPHLKVENGKITYK